LDGEVDIENLVTLKGEIDDQDIEYGLFGEEPDLHDLDDGRDLVMLDENRVVGLLDLDAELGAGDQYLPAYVIIPAEAQGNFVDGILKVCKVEEGLVEA